MNKSLSPPQPGQLFLHYAAYLLSLSHFLALQICLLPLLQHFPCIPPSWVSALSKSSPVLCNFPLTYAFFFLFALSEPQLYHSWIPLYASLCAVTQDLHPTQAKIALFALKHSVEIYLEPLRDFSHTGNQSRKQTHSYFFNHIHNVNCGNTFQTRDRKLPFHPQLHSS